MIESILLFPGWFISKIFIGLFAIIGSSIKLIAFLLSPIFPIFAALPMLNIFLSVGFGFMLNAIYHANNTELTDKGHFLECLPSFF